MTRLAPLAALVLAACAAGATTPAAPELDALRRRAAARPGDAQAWNRLAEAELLDAEGDPERTRETLDRALRLDPTRPMLHLLSGLEHQHHGRPADAAEAFVAALETPARAAEAARARNEDAAAQELAAAALEALAELAPRFPELAPRLSAALPALPPAAKVTVADVLTELAYRRGDAEVPGRVARAAGCLTSWRVAGPFGPRDLLGFDDAPPPSPLPEEVDLGPLRGLRPVRTLVGRGCATHLGEGPVADAGTTVAETRFTSDGAPALLRLETPNSVALRVDGREIARLDHRREPHGRVSFHRLELPAGEHRLSVSVSTRHPNPILHVALLPDAPVAEVPRAEGPLASYLAGALLMARGDPVAAGDVLAEAQGSSVLTSLRATLALTDPFLGADLRRDRSRVLYERATAQDPRAWFARLQLARLMAADGRDREALGALRELAEATPATLVPVALTRVELLLARGWDAQARRHVDAAVRAGPGLCAPLRAALALAQRRDRTREANALAERVVGCDARDGARYTRLVQARRWAAAAEELERLASLEPAQGQARFLASRLDLAEASEDPRAMAAAAEALIRARPRAPSPRLERADLVLAQGDAAGAQQVLEAALQQEPAAMVELRRIRALLGAPHALAAYRRDGREAIAAYEAAREAGRIDYAQGQVLVFDYAAQRVFRDGSALALTHQIYAVESEEAVDELGQFTVPEGAYVLTLGTRKASGRLLEPDLIEGLDSLALPALAVGDYVEMETVRVLDPPRGLPGGVLGERFYFASFEVPFFVSEQLLVVPEGMELAFDPRGDAPTPERRVVRGLQELRWRREAVAPRIQEPGAVPSREYLPSVQWGHGATWSAFLAGLRDVLADRDVADPAARRLAREITGGASGEEGARKLHRWVLENVDADDDVFGIAARMVARRRGNRARVLHYLLRLAGIDARLVMVRGFGADQTRSELADEDTYTNLIVGVEGDGPGSDVTYLTTAARGVPYGYLSPHLRGMDAFVLLPYAEAEELRRVELPAAEPGAESQRVELVVRVDARGDGMLRAVERYRGAAAINWRNDLDGVPAAVLDARFEEAYVARLFSGARMRSLRIAGREDPDAALVFRYDADVPQLARPSAGGMALTPLLPEALTARFAQAAERETTLIVAPPLDREVVVRVEDGAGAGSSLAPVTVEGPGGARFTMESQREGQDLVLTRRLRLPMMRVAPEDYAAFVRFCRAVDEAEARELPLP